MAVITIPVSRYDLKTNAELRQVVQDMRAKVSLRAALWERDQQDAREAAIERRRERVRVRLGHGHDASAGRRSQTEAR